MALAIVAALTAVAGVALTPARDAFRLAAETRQLALWLEQARGRALARGEPVEVQLDRAASRFVARADRLLGPFLTTGVAVQAEDDRGAVTFRPDGGATEAMIRLGSGSRQTRISVDGLTGRVRVVERPGAGTGR